MTSALTTGRQFWCRQSWVYQLYILTTLFSMVCFGSGGWFGAQNSGADRNWGFFLATYLVSEMFYAFPFNIFHWLPLVSYFILSSKSKSLMICAMQIIQFGEHLGANCSQSMSNQSKMANHLSTPSGDKMNKCSECRKSFCQADSHVNPQHRKNIRQCPMPEILRRHMITHSGEKVHNC